MDLRKHKPLIEKVFTLKNLRDAWNKLEKNPRSHGLSGENITTFRSNLENNLIGIKKQLKSSSYRFSKLRAAPIKKHNFNEYRPIRIPEIRDRVVIRAILNIIQPRLTKKYKLRNEASFAYQEDRGSRDAIERLVRLYHNKLPVVLKADIIKFFDTLDKNFLLSQLVFPSLPDSSLNQLIETSLSSEIGNRESLSQSELIYFLNSEAGIPQGNALSPLLSNIYLSQFDHEMLINGFGLVRYADDFIVLCNTELEAKQAYECARNILENNLHLKLHPLNNTDKNSKTSIFHLTQRPAQFLSVCFNGKRLWPSNENIRDLRTKIREATDYRKVTNVLDLIEGTRNLLEGWIAAFYYVDIEPFFKEIEVYTNQKLQYALFKMGWEFNKNTLENEDGIYRLSPIQRKRSGIPTCVEVLKRLREKNGKIELG